VTRRRKEPEARELVRFIAEHESLSLTLDEFPSLTEDRLREILKSYARPPESAAKQSRVERRRRRAADARDGLNVQVFTRTQAPIPSCSYTYTLPQQFQP
jgi:hypothetical protein